MFLRVYCFIIFLFDLLGILVKVTFSILESFFMFLIPPNEKSLEGEVALIIGASEDMTEELANQLKCLGVHVVLWTHSTHVSEKMKKTSDFTYCCDLTRKRDVLQVAHKIKEEIGVIDIMIQDCGFVAPLYPSNSESNAIAAQLSILETFLQLMIWKKHGHIVMMLYSQDRVQMNDLVVHATYFAMRGVFESLKEKLRVIYDNSDIHLTMAQIHPHIINPFFLRRPKRKYLGVIDVEDAVKQIVTVIQRNEMEICLPYFALFLKTLLGILPTEAANIVRDFLNICLELS